MSFYRRFSCIYGRSDEENDALDGNNARICSRPCSRVQMLQFAYPRDKRPSPGRSSGPAECRIQQQTDYPPCRNRSRIRPQCDAAHIYRHRAGTVGGQISPTLRKSVKALRCRVLVEALAACWCRWERTAHCGLPRWFRESAASDLPYRERIQSGAYSLPLPPPIRSPMSILPSPMSMVGSCASYSALAALNHLIKSVRLSKLS